MVIIYQKRSNYCTFFLAQLIHVVIYLLTVYGLLRYFKQNSHDSSLLNPTGPLPVFHHRPSYVQKVKFKLSPIKNPRYRHVHNSLSNVVIHMPCINIHRAGHYQLEMVFLRVRLPRIAMGNTLHGFDCIQLFLQQNKEAYVANSCLIGDTCTVIST